MGLPSTIRFEAREPRGPFGKFVKFMFWLAVLLPPVLMLATCAGLHGYVLSDDPEVQGGAALVGAGVLAVLWTVWLFGVPVLGLLMLLTRGQKLVIEHKAGS